MNESAAVSSMLKSCAGIPPGSMLPRSAESFLEISLESIDLDYLDD